MNRSQLALVGFAFLGMVAAGCTRESGGTVTVELTSTVKERQEYGESQRSSYSIAATGGALASGAHLVIIRRDVKIGDESNVEVHQVVLRDGRGTLETATYRATGAERPQYSPWAVDGAIALSPVTIAASADPTSP